ncbi:hypothetical protein ACFYN0_15695 [Streptomyces sp. NPDC006704]|uniref:hypothetical protein n=1 Tax=Streptomyces sp. NPDC006704 TaxID=3364760 RepID=UPI00368E6B03
MCAAKDPTLPSPGDSIPRWVNDLGRLHFFSKSDGDQVKAKANGLSIGLDHVKVALGVTAVGLTALKLDFTALKIDEKGIVFLGKQKVTWPHARDDKAKGEAAEKRINKNIKRFDKKIGKAQWDQNVARRSGGQSYLQARADKSYGKLKKLEEGIVAAQRELERIKRDDDAKKRTTEKLRGDESGNIARVTQEVARLSSALAGGS